MTFLSTGAFADCAWINGLELSCVKTTFWDAAKGWMGRAGYGTVFGFIPLS